MMSNFQDHFPQFSINETSHHHVPKLKTSYAAGFRKYQVDNQPVPAQLQQQPKSLGKQVLSYINRLGIQNLSNLYKQTIKNEDRIDYSRIKQEQQEYVHRLYSNQYPKRAKKTDAQSEPEDQKQKKKFAQNLWNLDKKYENAPVEFITAKQIQKFHKKMKTQLNGVSKRNKIEPALKYEHIFACFLIQQHEQICKNATKQEQLFFLWKGFISTLNLKLFQSKYKSKKMLLQTLLRLTSLSKYVFCLILIPKNFDSASLTLSQVQSLIPNDFKVPAQAVIDKFGVHKEYTSPYCIQYKMENLVHQKEQESFEKFKANPVPKSTYEAPKEKDKMEIKTTEIKPFNCANPKKQAITYEEYYHWDTNFKANPVPTTTYKPEKPKLLSEAEIKARATMNLQKSSYPKTMQNLNNYAHEKSEKVHNLERKYERVHSANQRTDPPNFQYLHARDLVQLENLKEQNKKQTKVQPFNLSVTKSKPVQFQTNNWTGISKAQRHSPSKVPPAPSKSTKKQDAYVQYRAKAQQVKLKKSEQEQIWKEAELQKKKPYREIIKQQMYEQLQGHPKPKRQAQKVDSHAKMVLNKQKIYSQKPLLMRSNLPPQQYKLPWETILQ